MSAGAAETFVKRLWALVIFAAAGCAAANTASPSSPPASRAPTTHEVPTPSASPFHNRLGTHPARLGDLQKVTARAPTRLVIPALGVDAPIQAVGTDPASGQMQLPPNVSTVAWWSYGARPGDHTGVIVLAAHVDFNGQYGLFFHLNQLKKGANATVITANGSSYHFRVTASRQVPKPALSGQDIFRTTGIPQLALVTCGGDFNPSIRSYLDNVIVNAAPA
jgi:sortase (surface protein transpeptidase)